ncbi:MAG: GTPase ObgE [Actinomycetota bacterium]|nr:GTPase ObgE [Actinomycetota bacterium]
MFLDEAKINIKAGNGGSGSVSFFLLKDRVKKIACGGNGGKGGDIIIEASANLSTLYGFKYKIHYKAQNGQRGSSNKKAGKSGEDLFIKVPQGTIIKNQKGEILFDLDKSGDKVIVAKGGRGGRGNASFVSQKLKFPSFAEKGEETESMWINLELQLVADVALVGFPNAGKSSIISMISRAKPKIADYPFTTTTPNLGMVYHGDESFVVADIPGLIKGAHMGVGLGDKFLRHIIRTMVIVFVLDCQHLISKEKSLSESFLELREELKLYNADLYDRNYIIAINKIDLISDRNILNTEEKKLFEFTDKEIVQVSAKTGENIIELVKVLSEKVRLERNIKMQQKESLKSDENIKVYALDEDSLKEDDIKIIKKKDEYFVENRYLERMISMTDLDNEEALEYLKNRLKKMGIGDKLKKMGIKEGSTVIIGTLVFKLID